MKNVLSLFEEMMIIKTIDNNNANNKTIMIIYNIMGSKSGARIRGPNPGPESGARIRGPNPGPESGPRIPIRIRGPNPGPESGARIPGPNLGSECRNSNRTTPSDCRLRPWPWLCHGADASAADPASLECPLALPDPLPRPRQNLHGFWKRIPAARRDF